MKPLYPYISFVAILLLGMFFSFSNYYTSKNILDVDNVMVNKDNTVSFTFSLSQDDIISIGTTKKDGKREKFNIRILNVNTDTPFSFSSTTAEYVIPEDGLYKVEFKNRRKIYLDIDVELRTDIEAGGINLQKATFYVGPDKKRFKQSQFDKPIFSFTGLEEGSQVAIGCGDRGQAAQLLRCRYRQMDDTRYVNTGPNYTIQEQGDMIIDFSLDEQNEGLVEKLFKGKKDLLFEDVIFTYTPKEEEYIPPRVVADAGGDPMADYFANLDSQAEMENQNMEAMALLQQQGIDANAEMVEGIGKVIQMMLPQQQIEHKAVFDNTYTLREKGATEEYFTVYPTMDLINGNKVCFSLI
ncbi:MAG: hypothetical protein ACPG5P_00430, partial [Saprospiraceae bacterium]